MSLENISSDENITKLKSQTSNKIRHNSRKVNWTSPTAERETYRTVVVNYHYKVNKNRRNGTSTQKKRDSWTRALAAKRKLEETDLENDIDDIPNLEGLYALSEDESAKAANGSDTSAESLKTNSSVLKNADMSNYRVDNYSVPSKQRAILQESCRSSVKISAIDSEIIVRSGGEDDEGVGDVGEASTSVCDHTKDTQTSNVNISIVDSSSRCKMETSQYSKRNVNSSTALSEFSSSDTSQKVKIKPQTQNTFKQRQLELHRHRIAVELKRLDLLEIKMARERDEMLREQILFERALELKSAQLKELVMDRDDLK